MSGDQNPNSQGMNLEKINKEYLKLKEDLEKAKGEVKSFEEQVNKLAGDKIVQRANLVQAQRSNDEDAEKQAQEEIKRIDAEVKKIDEKAKKQKQQIASLQADITERIEQVMANPEMVEHLNTVLGKKYERKLRDLYKEKQAVESKKSAIINLRMLVSEHPALENNLKGIFVAQKQITDLTQELESLKEPGGTYKDPVRATEINHKLSEAKDKLTANKNPLMQYINKNGLGITEQDIDELTKNGYVQDKKGNIDIQTTLNKTISGLNRQEKSYNKEIRNHEIAYSYATGMQYISPQEQETQSSTSQEQGTKPPTLQQQGAQSTASQQSHQEEKPKWYQFVKRFKNWNEKRHQQALPAGNSQSASNGSPIQNISPKDNAFKNSLKYDIVRDIVEQERRADLKEASKERRAQDENEH